MDAFEAWLEHLFDPGPDEFEPVPWYIRDSRPTGSTYATRRVIPRWRRPGGSGACSATRGCCCGPTPTSRWATGVATLSTAKAGDRRESGRPGDVKFFRPHESPVISLITACKPRAHLEPEGVLIPPLSDRLPVAGKDLKA